MDYEKAAAILVGIEQSVAVDRLRYRGLAMWPLIRLALWQQLASGGQRTNGGPRATSRIGDAFKSMWRAAEALRSPGLQYSGVDAAFLVCKLERRFEIEGQRVSPFCDSLREYAEDAGIRATTLDVSGLSRCYRNPHSLASDIAVAELGLQIRKRLRAFFFIRPQSIENFSDLARYIQRNYPALALDEQAIIAQYDLVNAMKRVFLRALKKIKPRALFLVCYYQLAAMACILACRDLGIRSVDIQHGQQGDYHGMYANWTKLPQTGYGLLPDYFWCWGEESAMRINRWSGPVFPSHRGVVGGNPWLARQINRPGSADQEALLLQLLRPGKVHVLVALQPVNDPISVTLLEAIASAPSNIQWLVRLHPMMRGIRENEIRRTLMATGNPNVELDLSSSVLLAGILRRADVIVTQWSSVAYDGLLFGAHPIIVHENGLKTFKKYIDRGLFTYAATAQEIIAAIGCDRSNNVVREDVPYIETREDTIVRAVRGLCSIDPQTSPAFRPGIQPSAGCQDAAASFQDPRGD